MIIPDCGCTGACVEACGVVPFSLAERSAVADVADFLGIGWTEMLGQSVPIREGEPLGVCPFLTGGRCGIYSVRPMVCRMYGSATGLPCGFGCRPTLTVEQEEMIMTEYLMKALG